MTPDNNVPPRAGKEVSVTSQILTRRQRDVLNAVRWYGSVARAYEGTVDRGAFTDEERGHRAEIRRLVRRGFLAHGLLTKKGFGVTNRIAWSTGQETLRSMVRESKR